MGEDTHEREILELIQLVDGNRDAKGKPLFKETDIFGTSLRFIFALFVLEIVIYVMFAYRIISFPDEVALSITLLAVLIASLSLIAQLAEVTRIDTRFERALPLGTTFNKNHEPFTENQKLILKALIKIRSKNDKFALKDVYDKNKEMFTREKLMEKLYQ
jgi:hypothetical protein